MKLPRFPLLPLCLSLLVGSALAESRTWTQAATGKTITGELQRVEGDKIRILRDGGVGIDVPLGMLAEADQKYVAEWHAKSALPAGPVQLTLADAHLCCGGCREAVIAAAAGIEGVTVTTEGKNVMIASSDGAKALQAVKAINGAGYFGAPSMEAFADKTTYATAKIKSLTLSGIHLCCGKCVTAATEAIQSADGVTGVTGVEKNATQVSVSGDFSPAALATALHAAGFHAGGLD